MKQTVRFRENTTFENSERIQNIQIKSTLHHKLPPKFIVRLKRQQVQLHEADVPVEFLIWTGSF